MVFGRPQPKPRRQVRAGLQESAGEPVRRAHGPERGHLRPVYERRGVSESGDKLDGLGGLPAATPIGLKRGL
jgi:hypothetical protein